MESIPFRIPEAHGGFAEVKGLAHLRQDALRLEYQVLWMGMVKGGLQTVDIPFRELESADFKKGWFGHRINIKGRSLRSLSKIPGTDSDLKLHVARKDRESADQFAASLALKLTDQALKRLNQQIGELDGEEA